MKHNGVRSVLTALLAVAAVFDIAEGILVLTGIGTPDVKFQGTPFLDTTVLTLLMTTVVGGSSLLAAATIFIRHTWSVFLATAVGIIMIVWEIIEIVVVQQFSGVQPIFVAIGLAIITLAEYLWTTEFRAKPLPTMKHKAIRIALIVIETFIGLSAIQGGIALLRGALDQWMRVAWLAGTPFTDYTIPGLVLVIVVGGSALLAAATVFISRQWTVLVSALAGLLVAGYEEVEIVSLDSKVGNVLLAALGLQLFYFVLGLLICGLAIFLWMVEDRYQHLPTRPQRNVKKVIPTAALELMQQSKQTPPVLIAEADLFSLPEAIQRYLKYTRVIGKEPIHTVRLKQRGVFKTQPGQKWLPMIAEEYITTNPFAFLWCGKIQLFPLVSISAWDRFSNGHGSLFVRLFSLVPLADVHGPEADQGELLRYLSEIIWFPTAWLSEPIEWQAIDAQLVKVTTHQSNVTVSAVLHVNEQGQVTHLTAERFMAERKSYRRERWLAQCDTYQEVSGMLIPTRVEVTWKLASGDFSYFRDELTEIEYNQSGKVTAF